MKATGIVRRIDDLGRIVIPKEIRKTLKIREGDPLEIFTDREGMVVLKKYSPVGGFGTAVTQYAQSLAESLGCTVCITDNDHGDCSGRSRQETDGRKLCDGAVKRSNFREKTGLCGRREQRILQDHSGGSAVLRGSDHTGDQRRRCGRCHCFSESGKRSRNLGKPN